jgi:hypothetical protein
MPVHSSHLTPKEELFSLFKENVLKLDPVGFAEKYLTLEGSPFRLHSNGFKPFADIYRYIGIKALEKDAKPVVLVKGRQVGGTIMAAVLEMYFTGSGLFGFGDKPPARIIHAFPQLAMAADYTKTKLNPMISGSIITNPDKKAKRLESYMQCLLDKNSDSGDSLGFKQFSNGNSIRIDSTGIDADRLRGRTADFFFFDEVQDMTDEAINNAVKILTASKYGPEGIGVQVYFGTPKRKGSSFHKRWLASSQQYYYLGCESCKKHFPLCTPENDDWEKIWLYDYIVKCTHCNHEQDKRESAERGKWVSTKDSNECLYVGFHINQLFMPYLTKEKILANKPGIHPTQTERAYKNEVLGEFYHGDSTPITAEEIREQCGEPGRKMRNQITPADEMVAFLGIDYGAKSDLEAIANPEKYKDRGQSFSSAVLIVPRTPTILSIEYATKFRYNDVESKKAAIDQIMRRYNVRLAVGDIGYSNDFSEILANIYGDRYLVSRAHNKINDKVKFSKDTFPKEIIFEKDFYLAELFDKLKRGEVKFPYGSYEKIAWLVQHCSSMDIKPSISRSGDPQIHYVKGSSPNDGLAALLNAYLAYKFHITKGFTTKGMVGNLMPGQKEQPLVVGAYISRKF